jgi:hypothetical protein
MENQEGVEFLKSSSSEKLENMNEIKLRFNW